MSSTALEAQHTLNAIDDAIFSIDRKGKILFANEGAARLLRLPLEAIKNRPVDEILDFERSTESGFGMTDIVEKFSQNKFATESVGVISASGARIRCLLRPYRAELSSEGRYAAVLLVHPLDAHTVDDKDKRSEFDLTTGLANRAAFEHCLETLVDDASVSERNHALLMIDIDQFKVINDTIGHKAGNEYLRKLSERLSSMVHHGDMIARIGGDEFGVLLNNVEREEAFEIAESLLRCIQNFVFNWHGIKHQQTASISLISTSNVNVERAPEMLRLAETTLYAAKDEGRNRIHVYASDDAYLSQRQREMSWIGEIRHALEHNRFRLFCHSIVPLDNTDLSKHFEVLLKMEKDGELIAPGEFIPAAERFNLMPQIDRWVIREFFDKLAVHPELLDGDTFCTINLSGLSLSEPSFHDFVLQQLMREHIRPGSICFEITETAAISHFGVALDFITRVRALGSRFALDDFGSGMSSFGYLQKLPVDYIKIDGQFIRDLEHNQVHRAMVKSIESISRALGKQSIAEFVENQHTLDILGDMGVNYAQGYLFGKPEGLSCCDSDTIALN